MGATLPFRESKCQTFHSIKEAMTDMIEHLVDTFDLNATFLNSCVICESTSVILVSIHLMFLKEGMKSKEYFGKKHSPVNTDV